MLTHSSFSFYSDSLFCGQKLFNSHPLKIYTTRGRSKSQVISRKRSIRSTFQPQLTTQNFIFSIFSSQSSTMFIAVQNKNARSEQKEFSATAASVSNRNHFWRAWYEQRSLMLRERKRKIFERESTCWTNELLGWLSAVTQRHLAKPWCFQSHFWALKKFSNFHLVLVN